MEQIPTTLNNLENLQQILGTLVTELAPLFQDDSVQMGSWRRSLETVAQSLQEQILRVAVVGSVKSGKSTFINALQGRDLLKRGAGIITSFITRIRSGSEEKGWIELKSWEEINGEINESLSLAALSRGGEGLRPMDLRRDEDRRTIEELLQETRQYKPGGHDTFDPNISLLNSYLNGYDLLGSDVGDEPKSMEFSGEELQRHQGFVGEESKAVYLRDMELQLPIDWLGGMVEIADCQGSDSPNPLHFALLQEYLLSSHCILYVISSRVGLRQGDLKLIEAVKIMRLLPQTLFILNVDLDEHSSLKNWQHFQEKSSEELRLLVPEARIYSFSALLQLLDGVEADISARERRRLEGWFEDEAMAQASAQGYKRFCTDLQNLVNRERSRILYGGILSHLQRVSQSMKDSVLTRQGLLSKNRGELKQLAEEIRTRQQSVMATLATIEHTLAGLGNSLKEKIRSAVDSYFDTKYGPILCDTMSLVEHHPVDSFDRDTVEKNKKWLANLYLFYHDFRQMLSRYIIDKVNLRIFDFGKNEEEYVEKKLLETAVGYWDLLSQVLGQYRETMKNAGLPLNMEMPVALPKPQRPNILVPPFSAFLQRSDGLGRGSLLLRFGLRRFGNLFLGLRDRVFRRDAKTARAGDEVFRQAVELVKKETQNELLTSFKDYRQNFKFVYLFPFVEQYTHLLVQLFRDFGEATMVDISHLHEAAHEKGTRQQDETEDLTIVRHRLQHVDEQLRHLEQRLGLSSYS